MLPKILNQISDAKIQHLGTQSQEKNNKSFSLNAYESLSYVAAVTNGYNADGAALDFSGYKPTYNELISYDHLIDKGNGTYNLTGKGFDETLKNLPQVVLKYKSQVTKLAKHLYSSDCCDLLSFCIFDVLINNSYFLLSAVLIVVICFHFVSLTY